MNLAGKDKPFKALSKRQKQRRLKTVWKFMNSESELVETVSDSCAAAANIVKGQVHHDRSLSEANNHDFVIADSDRESEFTEQVLINADLDRESDRNSDADDENCRIEMFDNSDNDSSSDDVEKLSSNLSDEEELNKLNVKCNTDCSDKLRSILVNWVNNEKNIKHACVDRLLSELSGAFDIPKCTKTLLDNYAMNIKAMDQGEYIHFNDWLLNIKTYLELDSYGESEIKLIVNIDGLNLFNALSSSKYSCYPILVRVVKKEKNFCVGIYCSNSYKSKEMPSPDVLLKKFFNDMCIANSEGIIINGVQVTVKISAFVCDAPVRAALKNTILHSGYSSCERCEVVGEYHCNTVVFLSTNSPVRTDDTFACRKDNSHHKSNEANALELEKIPMVTSFVLDSMHLCYLGVMKRFLNRLLNLKLKAKNCRLDISSRNLFDEKLVLYQNYIPSEFPRKLEGGISTILKWKASQYRLFALYVGLVLLSYDKIVTSNLYSAFLKFSIALRLLNTENQGVNISFIQHLLINFIDDCKAIFGPSFISYNVHSLQHIPQDYENFGMLDTISAFPFRLQAFVTNRTTHSPYQFEK